MWLTFATLQLTGLAGPFSACAKLETLLPAVLRMQYRSECTARPTEPLEGDISTAFPNWCLLFTTPPAASFLSGFRQVLFNPTPKSPVSAVVWAMPSAPARIVKPSGPITSSQLERGFG